MRRVYAAQERILYLFLQLLKDTKLGNKTGNRVKYLRIRKM